MARVKYEILDKAQAKYNSAEFKLFKHINKIDLATLKKCEKRINKLEVQKKWEDRKNERDQFDYIKSKLIWFEIGEHSEILQELKYVPTGFSQFDFMTSYDNNLYIIRLGEEKTDRGVRIIKIKISRYD